MTEPKQPQQPLYPARLPPPLWGIWLPGKGWFKSVHKSGETEACGFARKSTAKFYAAWLGGRVAPIDVSLAAAEVALKEAEAARNIRMPLVERIRNVLHNPTRS